MANDFLNPTISTTASTSGYDQPATFSWTDSVQRNSYLALVGFTAVLVYAYLNMFAITARFWDQPAYSHGWIIPIIALYLLWSRRPHPAAQEPPRGEAPESFLGLFPCSAIKPLLGAATALLVAGVAWSLPLAQWGGLLVLCLGGLAYTMVGQPYERVASRDRWIGLAMILAALMVRTFIAAPYHIEPINRLTFVIALFGLFLMVGGWKLITWAGPAIGFLLFMYPLPTRIEGPLLSKLQKVAAIASEVVLTILGMPVVRDGNKITVDGMPLTVAEECSGLRMMTIFGAMALAMVFLTNRPWWDRLIILLSAVPIALLVNIVRIVLTAVLLTTFHGNETLEQLIHDWAGFAMMPLAMGLLYLELKILSSLTVPEESFAATPTGMGPLGAR